MDIENQLATLQAMLSKIRLDDPKFKSLLQQQVKKALERKEERAKDRETIRRLKIQNKKLLERVESLKAQLKKNKDG